MAARSPRGRIHTRRFTKVDRRDQFTGKTIVPLRQSPSAKIFLANHTLLLSTVPLLPGNLPRYVLPLQRFRPA